MSRRVRTAQDLRRLLVAHGTQVLAVMGSESDPDQLVVYLHGLGGEAMQGSAFEYIAAVVDVAQVRVSDQTTSILIVRLHAS